MRFLFSFSYALSRDNKDIAETNHFLYKQGRYLVFVTLINRFLAVFSIDLKKVKRSLKSKALSGNFSIFYGSFAMIAALFNSWSFS